MYELKTNTAARIAVGPLVDPTDGKTAETALTVTDLSVQLYQIKNDGTAVVRSQFAPTASGGNNDMIHVADDTAGVYDLELTAAQLNFLGNGRITFYDVDGFLVHWIDVLVVSAAYFDWKYGTTKPEMNLADDAITAAKYDESTAFPVKSADTGSTTIARVGADADTLKTLSDQIDGIVTTLGAAGAGLTAIPWNAAWDAEVQSECTDALNAYDPPTNTEMVAAIPAAAAVADAVWNEAISDHLTAGSTGNALNAAGSAGDPWSTPLPGAYGAGTAGKIIGDNINAPIGTVDTVVDAIKAKTDNLPASPANEATLTTITGYLDTEVAAILADTNELQTDLVNGGRLDLLIDAIKAKTDNLPTDPADQSAVEAAITAATSPLATSAALDAVDNYVDAEVAAIKAVTDKLDTAVELDGAVYRFTANALEQAPTGGGTAPTVQEIVDGVLDELLSGHTVVGSVGAGITAAGSAGDPWSTPLPGAYVDGTAGYLVGNNMPSAGSGSTSWPYRLTDAGTGEPIAGAAVRVSTDVAGTVTVANGTTDANGYVTFNLDPGTYYIWRTKTGYTFSDPDTEVVS